MKGGHQRRALSAGSDVAGAEIRYHPDAGPLGQYGRCVQLHRISERRHVSYGLAMTADGRHGAMILTGGCQKGERQIGVQMSQFDGGALRAVDFVFIWLAQREQCVVQRRRKAAVSVAQNAWASLRKVRKHGVHPVEAGA